MVVFHEIIGPILASVAVILTLFLFKRSIDFQAYREIDSDYTDILKISIDHPELRDKKHIDKYPNFDDKIDDKIDDKRRYDNFALIVWNMLEAMYDRNKIDKTWYPVLETEGTLHYKWIRDPENRKYFKDEFLEFIDKCFNEVPPGVSRTPTEMQMRTEKELGTRTHWRIQKIAGLGVLGIVVFVLIITMITLPSGMLYDLQYFDKPIAIDCAKNYTKYGVGNQSDCAQFSSGSLAELCAADPKQFNKSDISDCHVFVTLNNTD